MSRFHESVERSWKQLICSTHPRRRKKSFIKLNVTSSDKFMARVKEDVEFAMIGNLMCFLLESFKFRIDS